MCINGLIKENTVDTGLIIKWKDMEYSIGQMGESMKEIILMIKSMDMGYLFGQMVKFIKDFGQMENRMVMD